MGKPEIFISHSHQDADLAAEFERFLNLATRESLTIHNSSRAGSIEGGESWIDWIHKRVESANVTFVLLTPSSFSAKWVLWEAGAVAAVKRVLAIDESADKKNVIPVKIGLDSSESLGPFQSIQVVDGLNEKEVEKMAESLLNDLRPVMGNERANRAIRELEAHCNNFVTRARASMERLQISQRQDLVQEWIDRLDRAIEDKNFAAAHPMRRWISIAFLGPGRADESETPFDFRIHQRLAQMFTTIKEWRNARGQLELARKLSPRDMLILRELGRVELELENVDGAEKLFKSMESLDPNIFEADEEGLSLYVRILISSNEWPEALRRLEKATILARRSAYIQNLRAIATLKVEGPEKAAQYFRTLKEFEEERGAGDYWSKGNLVNAALGMKDKVAADSYLDSLRGNPEAQSYKNSISRYFDFIIEKQDNFLYNWRDRWPNNPSQDIS